MVIIVCDSTPLKKVTANTSTDVIIALGGLWIDASTVKTNHHPKQQPGGSL
jgi:hypothetical protein